MQLLCTVCITYFTLLLLFTGVLVRERSYRQHLHGHVLRAVHFRHARSGQRFQTSGQRAGIFRHENRGGASVGVEAAGST